MLSLLIADSSDDFIFALSSILKDRYHISTCQNGQETLRMILRDHPDVLILDLELPELDGISLMIRALDGGAAPVVLATSCILPAYAIQAAEELGVAYLVRKPCNLQALSERICDLTQRLGRPVDVPENPRVFLSGTLLKLSIKSKVKGYGYLIESAMKAAETPNLSMTKDLYPAVGKLFGTTGRHVERSIRSAIGSAWARRDDAAWRQLFSAGPDDILECPSNGELIVRLAELVVWGNFAKIRL